MPKDTSLPELDLDFCRSHFPPIDNGMVYLENAGGSYVPRQVIDRLTGAMQTCQNQPHYPFASSKDMTARLDRSLCAMAEMIGHRRCMLAHDCQLGACEIVFVQFADTVEQL